MPVKVKPCQISISALDRTRQSIRKKGRNVPITIAAQRTLGITFHV